MIKHYSFVPAKGMANRHLQTLIPVVLGRFKKIRYIRQELPLPDGDFVDVDWTSLPDKDGSVPIIIIFHGLEGSSYSHYAKSLMRATHSAGWHGVVMNFRSCSGRQNRMSRLYHSGETEDARYFIDHVKQLFPKSPLFAAGFSLGGNMLLKLAGEQGDALSLHALASVSAPVDLDMSTRYMIQGLPRYYQAYLLRALKSKVLNKYPTHDYQSIIGLHKEDIVACSNIRQFDHIFTSRLHGFDGAEDYYKRCSANSFIADISKPALIIHAEDDPLAPARIYANISHADNVQLQVSAYGGHAGYLGGSIRRPQNWVAEKLLAYFAQFV